MSHLVYREAAGLRELGASRSNSSRARRRSSQSCTRQLSAIGSPQAHPEVQAGSSACSRCRTCPGAIGQQTAAFRWGSWRGDPPGDSLVNAANWPARTGGTCARLSRRSSRSGRRRRAHRPRPPSPDGFQSVGLTARRAAATDTGEVARST